MHTGLWCTLRGQFPTGVGLVTWLFSECQTCLNSSCALCTMGCAPAFPESHMLTVVHTSYRWLAPRLLAQAGGDTGRSQIGVSWGKQWLVLSMAEEPRLSSYTSAALRNLSTSDASPRPSGVLYCPHWLHLTGVLCTVFTSKLGCVSACIAGVQPHNILVLVFWNQTRNNSSRAKLFETFSTGCQELYLETNKVSSPTPHFPFFIGSLF